MFTHKLGHYLPYGETLYFELKEFMLKVKPIDYMDEDEIINASHGKITDRLQIMLHDNWIVYVHKYLPTYVSAFANTPNDGKQELSTLVIGVDDIKLEITGIPMLSSKFIHETIKNELFSRIRIVNKYDDDDNNDIVNNKIKMEFVNNIKVNIVDVTNPFTHDDINKFISDYEIIENERINMVKQYKQKLMKK